MTFTPVQLNSPAKTSSARKGIFSIITVGLQGGTRTISNWLIARVAGPAIYGAVANAFSLASLLHTSWPSSAQQAASKFIARARGKQDDAEVHAVANHISIRVLQVTCPLAVVAPVLWMTLYGGTWWEGLCVSAMLITLCTSTYARGVHFGAGQVARGTRVDIVSSVIGIAGTGLLLALGVHNLLLTVPLSLAMGAYSLLCWPWTAHGRPGRGLRSEIDKFVTFSAIGSIASSGMLYLSQMITGWFGDAASGVYAAAAQLVTPMAMITGALTAVLYPALAAAHGAGDSEKLRSHTDLTTRGFVALLVPVFGALAIASRPLIHLIYELGRGKEGYMEAAVLMPVFCVALLLNNVATPSVSAVTSGAHRNVRYSMLLSQAGLLTAIVVWVTTVPFLGLFGIALGYGAGATLTALSLMGVAWRQTGQRWNGLAFFLLGSAALIGLASWAIQSLSPSYWIDLVSAVIFGIVWLGLSVRPIRRVISALRS